MQRRQSVVETPSPAADALSTAISRWTDEIHWPKGCVEVVTHRLTDHPAGRVDLAHTPADNPVVWFSVAHEGAAISHIEICLPFVETRKT